MSKCGVCGGGIALTVVPHAELCEDDRKAPSRKFLPEIDDLIKQLEEEEGNE